jgi:hypothetical protein
VWSEIEIRFALALNIAKIAKKNKNKTFSFLLATYGI